MSRDRFEELVTEEFPNAVPERFQAMIKNVAFIVEDEPSEEVRREEGLLPEETLLGYYRGVPTGVRGTSYGIGGALPDTITLYQVPIEEEAQSHAAKFNLAEEKAVREVIRDTIWHEIGHHFGLDEASVRMREEKRQRGS